MLKGGFASFFIKTYSRLPIYQEIKSKSFLFQFVGIKVKARNLDQVGVESHRKNGKEKLL